MKVAALTRLMNDHGTHPRINVYHFMKDCTLLVYEGHPDNADQSVKDAKVESFTVAGEGFLKIYTR